MTINITINTNQINALDLSPLQTVIERLSIENAIASSEQKLQFDINYNRDKNDPRELSEIPEVRLWFIRADSQYPWLPFLLDWQAGEFVRYTAMLVPHQFSSKDGIQYNPEALEIYLMHKVFILADWLKAQGLPPTSRLKSMAQLVGYELDEAFFEVVL